MRFLLAILCLLSFPLRAATNYTSPQSWDLFPLLTNAAHGDTIILTNIGAEATWTNVGYCTKAIRLHGTSSNNIVIIDEVASRSVPLLTFIHTNLNVLLDVSQITFKPGTNNGVNVSGLIAVKTTTDVTNGPPFRMHHLFFDRVSNRPFFIYAYANYLIDHCTMRLDANSRGMSFSGQSPDNSNKGHLSWALPVYTGTTNEGGFIENCYITNMISSTRAITDGFGGARYVFRFNDVYGAAAENHGTESGGDARGVRWLGVISNNFAWNGSVGEASALYRSGSGVVIGNTNTGNWPGMVRLYNHRYESDYSPWRGATGTNAWDTNYAGGAVQESGAHTGTNGSYAFLVDTNKNWTTNQWAGYTCVVQGSTNFSLALWNNATSITFYGSTFVANRLYFTNGNNYELRLIVKALDQPGAGSGHLLTGGSSQSQIQATNTITLFPSEDNMTNGYPNTDDPIHIWGNVGDATNIVRMPRIIETRDFVFGEARPGYVQLTYPHPLAGGGGGSAYTATAGNVTVQGNLIIQNEQ